jgi:hypothetical protein
MADLEHHIVEGSLCALAEASAMAISVAPRTCLAGGIVYADTSQVTCPAHSAVARPALGLRAWWGLEELDYIDR